VGLARAVCVSFIDEFHISMSPCFLRLSSDFPSGVVYSNFTQTFVHEYADSEYFATFVSDDAMEDDAEKRKNCLSECGPLNV